MDAFGLESYLFEPEFTEEELRQRDEELAKVAANVDDSDSDTNVSNTITDSSSATDEEAWCRCCFCTPVENDKEKVCCQGLFGGRPFLASGDCLTNIPEFSHLLLQPIVLELGFVQFLRSKKKDPSAADNMTNRQRRLVAYRHLALWSNHSVPFGKGVRIALPSCCINAIRSRFPEDDAGSYVGFKEVTDAIEME